MSLIREDNLNRASLDDWEDEFFSVYGDLDKKLPLYDMMLQLVADSTRIAEAMRRGQFFAALPYIPRVFSWLCSITSKCRLNLDKYSDLSSGKRLSEIIWFKYPRLCAFCAKPQCTCPALHVDAMNRKDREDHMQKVKKLLADARQNHQKPKSLDEWVFMFEDIYGSVNAARSSAEKTFHFLEEIGEVEVELRKADRIRQGLPIPKEQKKEIEWENEIADVFSWLSSVYLHNRGHIEDLNKLAIALGLDKPFTRPVESFSSWVWKEFGNQQSKIGLRCHRCERPKCICHEAIRR